MKEEEEGGCYRQLIQKENWERGWSRFVERAVGRLYGFGFRFIGGLGLAGWVGAFFCLCAAVCRNRGPAVYIPLDGVFLFCFFYRAQLVTLGDAFAFLVNGIFRALRERMLQWRTWAEYVGAYVVKTWL